MKFLQYLVLSLSLMAMAGAASLENNIKSEAAIVTKAGLRAHVAAGDGAPLRPATYAELGASRGEAQPDYLIVRFKLIQPGHYSGEAEARIDGSKNGTKLNVALHFNKGWVEYYIPLDGVMYGPLASKDSPLVTVQWNSLQAK